MLLYVGMHVHFPVISTAINVFINIIQLRAQMVIQKTHNMHTNTKRHTTIAIPDEQATNLKEVYVKKMMVLLHNVLLKRLHGNRVGSTQASACTA